MSFKKFLYSFLIGASFLAIIIVGVFWNNLSEVKGAAFSDELPFGISNPTADNIDQLPEILRDLRLSEESGIAGFVVDTVSRKNAEICEGSDCSKVRYDFSELDTLIDAVAVKGKSHLWIVINPVTNNQFQDGRIRDDKETYLPDGPISRQAFKNYLTALVNHAFSYGRAKTGNANWYVIRWNIFNEVISEYKQTFGKKKAPDAYAKFVLDTAEILRRLSPEPEIVLGGGGSKFDTGEGSEDAEFYKAVFKHLATAKPSFSPFDAFESHWFSPYQSYGKNWNGIKVVKDIYTFLARYGHSDKRVIIRAGATYSGQDLDERKRLMDTNQTESQQAEFLFKRFIYNLGEGAVAIPWSTTVEHKRYQTDEHVIFNFVGLIYNDFPTASKCKPDRQKPCPDPGKGIKKLAYFTYKLLNEKLRGSDFDNIQIIKNGSGDNLYLYKFNKGGKPIYVAWWDYFASGETGETKQANFTLPGISASQVKITEAIPNFPYDFQKNDNKLNESDYPNFFNSSLKPTQGGNNITIILGTKPVYIEAYSFISPPPPPPPPPPLLILIQNGLIPVTGYAWSDNLGWIKFDGLSSYPVGGGAGTIAKANTTTGAVEGWARAYACLEVWNT